MADKRAFYMTKTFWGCVTLFIAAGLEGIGVTGSLATIQSIAGVIGIPLTTYSVAERFRK